MLLIKNGALYLPGGKVLTDSDVLVQDGHIKEIGKDLASADACVFDACGKDVFPGFILPVSSVGLTDYADFRHGDANDVSAPNQAGLHVRYALDGREVALQRYWLRGITSIGAAPGKKMAIDNDSAADSRSDADADNRFGTVSGTDPGFSQCAEVAVVAD